MPQPRQPRSQTYDEGKAEMSGKQIEFPEKRTHVKSFEYAVLAISIILAIIVLVIVLGTSIGDEFRPTV